MADEVQGPAEHDLARVPAAIAFGYLLHRHRFADLARGLNRLPDHPVDGVEEMVAQGGESLPAALS